MRSSIYPMSSQQPAKRKCSRIANGDRRDAPGPAAHGGDADGVRAGGERGAQRQGGVRGNHGQAVAGIHEAALAQDHVAVAITVAGGPEAEVIAVQQQFR